MPGIAGVGFGEPVRIRGSWKGYDTITGHGDFNGDGKVDLLVRAAGSSKVYVKPNRGNGRFGHPLGPIDAPAGATGLNAGASAYGASAPDLIARMGDTVVLMRNAGTYETGSPIATGVVVPKAGTILNAGDWDRDGAADMIVRNRNSGKLWLYRGNGQGQFAAPTALATGFKSVKLLAAVGDMTGDGWPDLTGQPAGGSMRIYPGSGISGLQASYAAFKQIKAGIQVPVGRWDADGAPDSLFRSGKRVSLYPGNGPGGFLGRSRAAAQREALRLDGGRRRHGGQRPFRSRGEGEEDRVPLAAAGHHDGVLLPGLPGAGVQGVRPGRLGPLRTVVEAARAALRGVHPGHVLTGGGPRDEHEGAATPQRLR